MYKEISAELLLNYLYPERIEKWTVDASGTFYRNYNQDCQEVDLELNSARLSRDGLMRLLPEGFFTDEKSKMEETREQEQWRLKLLRTAFMPLDSFAFRTRLKLEEVVDSILHEKDEYMLQDVFWYKGEANPYKEVDGLLPLIRNRRGDLQFVKALLTTLCQCEVTMDCSHRYSKSDSTRRWLPMVRYELNIPDLDSEEFNVLHGKLQSLIDFIHEWLLPFDLKCEIVIRHHGCEQVPGDNLILDYNTEL